MIKKSTYIDTSMNTNEIKTCRLIIKGKVQGVGFRHWFSDLAISLGLNGYIQNKESKDEVCLLYTSPSPRDLSTSRMPSSA